MASVPFFIYCFWCSDFSASGVTHLKWVLCAWKDCTIEAFKWIRERSSWKCDSPELSATQKEPKPAPPVDVCIFTLVGLEPDPRIELLKRIVLQEVWFHYLLSFFLRLREDKRVDLDSVLVAFSGVHVSILSWKQERIYVTVCFSFSLVLPSFHGCTAEMFCLF